MLKSELQKVIRQKRLYIIVLICIAIFVVFFFLNNTNISLVQKKDLYNSFKDTVYNEIEMLERNVELSNEERQSFKNDYLLQYQTALELRMSVITSSWQRELNALNQLDEITLSGSPYVNYDSLIESELQNETPYTRIEFRNYLLEHEIKPNSSQTKLTASALMLKIFADLLPFVLPILITCISILCVYEDFSSKSYKFLFQMPYSRIRIISSKLFLCMLLGFIILILSLLISLLVSCTANGIGYLEYPIRASQNLPYTFPIGNNSYIEAGNLLYLLVLTLPHTVLFYSVYSCLVFSLSSSSSSIGVALFIPFVFMSIPKYLPLSVFEIVPITDVCHYNSLVVQYSIAPALSIAISVITSLLMMFALIITVKRKQFY